MKQKKEYTGMPLSLWGISAITALAILSLLYLFVSFCDIQPNKNRTKLLSERTYVYDLNRKLDAYFIGSSLTRGALLAFNSLENSTIENNKRLNCKIVVGNGFSLDEFNYKIKEIKILRPKCLFIESNLVCKDTYGNLVLSFRHRLSRYPVDLINMSNLIKVNNDFISANFNGQFDPDFKTDKNNKEPELKLRIRGINEFRRWKRFFKVAEEHGIKIYLIEMPLSIEAQKLFPNSIKQQINSLVDKYSEDYGVGYLGFPEKLTYTKYYIDGEHFNKPGADYYSDWLVNEIFNRKLLR